MRFQGDVVITRGEESLKTQRLNLNLSPDLAFVYRAVAIDDMELHHRSGHLGGDRPRVLRGRKLDAWFDDDSHQIREAQAGPRASLSIPGPAGGPDRSLTAYMINLKFDAQGRLSELAGVQDAVLVEAPSGKGKQGGERTVRCAAVVARMDPASGSIRDMDFQGGVEIVEPKRHASAHNGHYVEEGQVLALTTEARVLDEGQGSDLRADAIELRGKSGDLSARENVRHQVTPRSKTGPFGGDRPDRVWQMTSRLLDYDGRQANRPVSGRRAPAGRRRRSAGPPHRDRGARPGQRKLTASGGGVVSVLHPRNASKEGPSARGAGSPSRPRARKWSTRRPRARSCTRARWRSGRATSPPRAPRPPRSWMRTARGSRASWPASRWRPDKA